MKIILVISLFALIQVGYASDFGNVVSTGFDGCVTKLGYNKEIATEKMKDEVIAEDNEKAVKFIECFSKAIGIQKDNGDIDNEKLLEFTKFVLKQRHPDLSDAEYQSIASNAVEKCKDTPKGPSDGVTGIRMRNCVKKLNRKS